eukprot:gb/GFBE01060873.1/.p1 GENE.gb/GFBE01060873.1/~~gb/GFBE01060873.1/.p1  ORF type:complete len:266 (+),score=30.50 gb/GFBE01060873.1/:1-798(+)
MAWPEPRDITQPPSPCMEHSGFSTVMTPTGVDDRSANPQVMFGCSQQVQIFVPVFFANYISCPCPGPLPKREEQLPVRQEGVGHSEEIREISQAGQEGPEGQEVPTQAPEEQVPMGSIATRPVPLGYTTLVVRNIPARYNQEMLLREFGADGGLDFLHLPYSFRDQRTMGYAFLNFRTHQLAIKFQEKRHHTFLQDHGRTKYLDVTAATKQGLATNVLQFTPKSVARLQRVGMLPIFLNEVGVRVDAMREMQRYGVIPPTAGRRY